MRPEGRPGDLEVQAEDGLHIAGGLVLEELREPFCEVPVEARHVRQREGPSLRAVQRKKNAERHKQEAASAKVEAQKRQRTEQSQQPI